jgi:hypothetical protein
VWPGPAGAPGTGAFQCVGGTPAEPDGGSAVAGGASSAHGGTGSMRVGSESELTGAGAGAAGASINVGASIGSRGVGGGVISPVV